MRKFDFIIASLYKFTYIDTSLTFLGFSVSISLYHILCFFLSVFGSVLITLFTTFPVTVIFYNSGKGVAFLSFN